MGLIEDRLVSEAQEASEISIEGPKPYEAFSSKDQLVMGLI
jgi:hypothetical protein